MVLAKHRLKGLFIHVTSRDVVWLFEEKTETSKVNLFVEILASLFPWRIITFVDEKFWKWRRSKDIFLINYVNIFCRPIEKLNCNINISNICWNFYCRTTLTSNDVTFLMECTCIIKAWIILCGMRSKVFNTDASCFEHILTYSNIIHCCLFFSFNFWNYVVYSTVNFLFSSQKKSFKFIVYSNCKTFFKFSTLSQLLQRANDKQQRQCPIFISLKWGRCN